MKKRPFTIQTYFPSGNTRGYRISQIPTRTVQAIYIPRFDLDVAIENRPELNYNGIYFLFEEEEPVIDHNRAAAYIGESETIYNRLKRHHKERGDWSVAVAFTTTGEENQLTKADIKYLENYCYQRALEADRYSLNQNTPTQSFVHEAREADLMDMYSSIADLLSFLGFPIFMPKMNEKEMRDQDNYYYITSRGSDAKAIYSQDGMTVIKGSRIASSSTKSFSNGRLLNELKETKIIDDEGIFVKDYTFTKPSTAASIVALQPANGWIMWKRKDGKTLDECVTRY